MHVCSFLVKNGGHCILIAIVLIHLSCICLLINHHNIVVLSIFQLYSMIEYYTNGQSDSNKMINT